MIEYLKRGWLSPGCAAAGLRFAVDIVTLEEAPAESTVDPTYRHDARARLKEVRLCASVEQVELLEAVARDDHAPGLWSRVNGHRQEDGLPALRAALRAIRLVYVKDGTE